MHHSHSVGVIGGADGPTAIFVSGGLPMSVILLGGLVLAALVIVAVVMAKK